MKKNFEETVLNALANLQTDVGELKDDVSELKDDVSELKDDVSGLKDDVSGLKDDVSGLKNDVRRLEVLQEETSDKFDKIIEGMSPTIEKTNENTEQLRDHEERISFVEKLTKVKSA